MFKRGIVDNFEFRDVANEKKKKKKKKEPFPLKGGNVNLKPNAKLPYGDR